MERERGFPKDYPDLVVASSIFYGVARRRSSLSAVERKWLDKLIMRPGSVLGYSLNKEQMVGDRRNVRKVPSLLVYRVNSVTNRWFLVAQGSASTDPTFQLLQNFINFATPKIPNQ